MFVRQTSQSCPVVRCLSCYGSAAVHNRLESKTLHTQPWCFPWNGTVAGAALGQQHFFTEWLPFGAGSWNFAVVEKQNLRFAEAPSKMGQVRCVCHWEARCAFTKLLLFLSENASTLFISSTTLRSTGHTFLFSGCIFLRRVTSSS